MDPLLTQTMKVMVLDLGGGVASRALVGGRGLTVLSARSFPEAMRAAPTLRPRAIVVALGQPELHEIESVGSLVKKAGAPVLLVSERVGEDRVVPLIKAGVKGYLFTSDVGHLAESVRELVRGGLPMSEPVSALVLGRARRPSGEFGISGGLKESVPPESEDRSSAETQRFPAVRQIR